MTITEYNSLQKRLVLPEYGRNVQQMVDHCLTIEDRAERTRCANTIINIMGNLFPHLRDIDDFKHKLWDHLAIMSDFKLDIDYPYEIVRPENLCSHPERVSYQTAPIRYRHYGKILENMLEKASEMPDGPERDAFISMLANHMKKLFIAWNKDGVDDEKILKDIKEYTHGIIDLNPDTYRLRDVKEPAPQRKQNNNTKKAGK